MESQLNGRLLLFCGQSEKQQWCTHWGRAEGIQRLQLSARFKVPPTQTHPVSCDGPFWGKTKSFFKGKKKLSPRKTRFACQTVIGLDVTLSPSLQRLRWRRTEEPRGREQSSPATCHQWDFIKDPFSRQITQSRLL